MKLQHASVNYGRSRYPVVSSDLLPLPVEFDFNDEQGCARKILAILSNASGGHTLTDCRVTLHRARRSASIVANGAWAYYASDERARVTVEEALKIERELERIDLGSVRTDQYGDGWKRAIWKD